MPSLNAILYVVDSTGTRVAVRRADGTYVPLFLQIGAGLTVSAAESGGLDAVTIAVNPATLGAVAGVLAATPDTIPLRGPDGELRVVRLELTTGRLLSSGTAPTQSLDARITSTGIQYWDDVPGALRRHERRWEVLNVEDPVDVDAYDKGWFLIDGAAGGTVNLPVSANPIESPIELIVQAGAAGGTVVVPGGESLHGATGSVAIGANVTWTLYGNDGRWTRTIHA